MSIDVLATWKSTFAALPLVSDGTWTTNISDWCDARVTAKAQVNTVTHATPPFTFAKATFKTELDSLTLKTSKAEGATQFANAWEAAINASTLTTIVNDFINPGGPANTWSTIYTSLIEPASIATAKANLISNLTSAPDVTDVTNSLLPQYLRQAFLDLTCEITGLDSVAPPPYSPLNLYGAALI